MYTTATVKSLWIPCIQDQAWTRGVAILPGGKAAVT